MPVSECPVVIFKGVRDGKPYPEHNLSGRHWAQIPPRQIRLDELVTTTTVLALDRLLSEDSTFYGDLFPHAVRWQGVVYLEDGVHQAVRAALRNRTVLHARVFDMDLPLAQQVQAAYAQMTAVRTLARLERAEFADLLDGLTPEQWNVPSLCDGWTVRDVAAHTIAYLGQSRTRLVVNMIQTRFDVDRLKARGVADYAELEPARLTGLMRQGVEPSGAAALYGGRVALIECLIHQQDIRRPLGQPRTIPEDRPLASLNYARISPVIGGARRTRGVRLVASDMDWSAGSGPEVRGAGEALLLAMTGRSATVVGELDGDGLALLR